MTKYTKGLGTIGIILAIAAIAILAYLFVSSNDDEDAMMEKEGESMMEKDDEAMMMEKEKLSMIMDSGEEESVELLPVDGSDSSGSAIRLIKEGSLFHAAFGQMPDPQEGNYYEGWLVREDPLDFFSTGVMEKDEDGNWQLVFEADMEYREHTLVVITEEEDIDDNIPERHVIEGKF